MAGRICEIVRNSRAVVVMVLVQFSTAGVNILYKLAADDGMRLRIVVAYRLLFATAFMLPLAFLLDRRKRPKFTWRLLLYSFISGLFGSSLPSNLNLESLALTSATFCTAVTILGPALTFIMAVPLGLENVGLGSKAGKAKILGTLLGIGGALFFTFYKGVEIRLWSTHLNLLRHGHGSGHVSHSGSFTFFMGALMALGSNISFSLWLLLQAKLWKADQGHYWNTSLTCLMGCIQTAVYALCTERDWKEWKLGWNIRLVTVAYSGIMISGIAVCLLTWCVQLKGPLFASIFNPLALIIVALVGSFALEEYLHLGSVIGTVLIIGGLYMVIWGKTQEIMIEKMTLPSSAKTTLETSPTKAPIGGDAHVEINSSFTTHP